MKCQFNQLAITFMLCFLIAFNLYSQDYVYPGEPPEGLTYQAEVRDSKGDPVKNTSFVVTATIILGPLTPGEKQWIREYKPVITDKYGMFTIILSDDPNGSTKDFANIEWWAGPHFLQVELIDEKGNDYVLPVTQFLSVPYAMHAETASSALSFAEEDPIWDEEKSNYYTKTDLATGGSSQVNWNNLLNIPNTLGGYGITDAVSITTDQTITGVKTFDSDITVNGLTIGRGYGSKFGNVAMGYQSLGKNTEGFSNIAIGSYTLHSNTIGTENIALGTFALYSNTEGTRNIALGYAALHGNTTGTINTAIGKNALKSNTSGSWNSALGIYSLQSNTTGDKNTAIGVQSLDQNTTGSGNTANGVYALFYNTVGSRNSAAGGYALNKNTDGNYNTAFGYNALSNNTEGYNNLGLGYQAGDNITTGSNNIIIGYDCDAPIPTGNDQLNIGNTIFGNLSSGNIGIGTTEPNSKLHVNGGIQISNDFDPPTPNKVGTIRYRQEPNASFVEICMKVGPGAYAWVTLKQFFW